MAASNADTQQLSPVLAPGHTRLTVVAGDCPEGMTFSLADGKAEVGRSADAVTLVEDLTVSPIHAEFESAADGVDVIDRDSVNGVYVSISSPREIEDGDWFRAGSQTFRLRLVDQAEHYTASDGTLHFVSPNRVGVLCVEQVLDGGKAGAATTPDSDEVTIGGEGADIPFPDDPYLSRRHVRVFKNASGGYSIQDLGSTNGTYVRVKGRATVQHGAAVYVGNTLLRVDVT